MTNLGLLGAVDVGKTTILRMFVLYLNQHLVENIEGGVQAQILKIDFSGESILDPEVGIKESKTIHPNRVTFKILDDNSTHSLFAPGGDRNRAVVRMGVITISRIAKKIIAIFDISREIEDQFKFFSDVRSFPREIYVCWNKCDAVEADLEDRIAAAMPKVQEYFEQRKIAITQWYRTSANQTEEWKAYNDATIKMLLDITLERETA
jgi:hypothetical protein